jgi:hypothetical protein
MPEQDLAMQYYGIPALSLVFHLVDYTQSFHSTVFLLPEPSSLPLLQGFGALR